MIPKTHPFHFFSLFFLVHIHFYLETEWRDLEIFNKFYREKKLGVFYLYKS